MALLEFLLQRYPRDCMRILIILCLVAIFQGMALLFLIAGAEQAYANVVPLRPFAAVLVCLLLYGLAWQNTTIRTQRLIAGMIIDIVRQISNDDIRDRLIKDFRIIPDAALAILSSVSAFTLTTFFAAYLGFIAPAALGILTLAALVILWFHKQHHVAGTALAADLDQKEQRLITEVRQFCQGLPNFKLGTERMRSYLKNSFTPIVTQTATARLKMERIVTTSAAFIDLWLLSGLGWIVFLFPEMGVVENIVAILAVIFFVWAQLRSVMTLMPIIEEGNNAIKRLESFYTQDL